MANTELDDLTGMTTPGDADTIYVSDSGVDKKLTFANIWTWVWSKFKAAANKATPVAADILMIQDSADSNAIKEVTLTNLVGNICQPLDQELTALADVTSAADKMPYFVGDGTASTATVTTFARSLLDDANEAAFKVTTNLEIGTDVLAEQTIGIADNNLMEVDGTANSGEYARFTANGLEGRTEAEFKGDFNLEIGTDVLAEQTVGIADDNLLEVDGATNADEYARFTANGLVGRTEAEFKGDFNLETGTDVQAFDALLQEISTVDMAADRYIHFDGTDSAQMATITTAGRAILDDADAAAQCTTLGLGTGDTPTFAALTITGGIVSNSLYVARSDGTSGGSGSAGAGKQYIEFEVNGTTYKCLHDGTA